MEGLTPILLDTDIGSDIDDALALAYLLMEERCELAGITTVTGDGGRRAALAQLLCDASGQPTTPIHPGASTTVTGPGQPHVPHYDAIKSLAHRTDWPHDTAFPFMAETIRSRPGEVVLLSIGPMTNVARLFSLYPETPSLLRAWFAMSGYFARPAGRGSWNLICDPASAAIAIAARVPRSVQVGEDVTTRLRLTEGEVMERFQHPLLKLVLGMAPDWFSNRPDIVFHDPLAAALIFDESLCRLTRGHIEIDPANGRTAIREDASGPHEVAREVRKEEFWRAFFSPFN